MTATARGPAPEPGEGKTAEHGDGPSFRLDRPSAGIIIAVHLRRRPMADEMKCPPGCVPVQAINPADGKVWHLFLRQSTMERTAIHRGLGAAKELGYTVPWT